MPPETDLSVPRGATSTIEFTVRSTPGGAGVRDLTGATVTFYAGPAGGPAVLTKAARVDAPLTGKAFWDWTAAESRQVPPGSLWVWEAELRQGGEQALIGTGALAGVLGINAD